MLESVQRLARAASGAIGRESWIIRQLRPAYESTLQMLSGERGVPWEINGVPFRIDPRYRNQLGKNYEADVAHFLSERIKPGSICFDVGANVGAYVLQLAHWTGPTGRVVGFEPNPAAVEVLSAHVQFNGFEPIVTIEKSAVGSSSGTTTMYCSAADGMSRLAEQNSLLDSAERITVPVITLDDFCARTGLEPDWILIDIEGFELAALRGAARTIERRRGNLGLVVEIHPALWDSAGINRADVEEFLSESGLRAIPLNGQRDPLGEYGLVHLSWSQS
ncbi:MAG TPA: FkbM family methyltransferase [Candidatus Binatus sp.]|nr:FkbM family methyltransferase [Candidatus Binatus sp.]